nr:PREDICTED: NFX1-type zinc finger-containing protein 1-like isoform X2 [Latimeria chalumnae]|eukprot:XP_014346107.1 PREDICTED: NFX1-type zinc finger-containing protein 1-like isoform X2 [Latimeria chalumnae]
MSDRWNRGGRNRQHQSKERNTGNPTAQRGGHCRSSRGRQPSQTRSDHGRRDNNKGQDKEYGGLSQERGRRSPSESRRGHHHSARGRAHRGGPDRAELSWSRGFSSQSSLQDLSKQASEKDREQPGWEYIKPFKEQERRSPSEGRRGFHHSSRGRGSHSGLDQSSLSRSKAYGSQPSLQHLCKQTNEEKKRQADKDYGGPFKERDRRSPSESRRGFHHSAQGRTHRGSLYQSDLNRTVGFHSQFSQLSFPKLDNEDRRQPEKHKLSLFRAGDQDNMQDSQAPSRRPGNKTGSQQNLHSFDDDAVSFDKKTEPYEKHHKLSSKFGKQSQYNPGDPRGRDRIRRPMSERRLDHKALNEILLMESSMVVMKLASPGSGLKTLLNESELESSLIPLILEVLYKACSCKINRENLQHMLGEVKDARFLKITLPVYAMNLSQDVTEEMSMQKILDSIKHIVALLLQLISVFPSSCVVEVSLVVTLMQSAINFLLSTGVTVPEEAENSLKNLHSIIQHLQEKKREGTLRSDNYTYITGTQEELNIENFRMMPIFPTYEDIHSTQKPFMRPNIINTKYADTDTYLDTHFRLLREDFIRPLRDGISQLKFEEKRDIRKRKFDDIRIYFNTHIIAPLCTRDGILYRVTFEVKMLKSVQWESSKRLLYGALVCLSKDNFETMLFATVANRNVKELQVGIVTLNFTEESRLMLADVKAIDSFLMIETSAYFEAYRHVLEGLKEIANNELPLQRYIVHCETDVSTPQYMMGGQGYSLEPLMEEKMLKVPQNFVLDSDSNSNKAEESDEDLINFSDSDEDLLLPMKIKLPTRSASPFFQLNPSRTPLNFNVLNFESWPSKVDLKLDDSQLRAIQMALTKELVIIQGPPGTGKTFVGLKIMKTLLANSHIWQPAVKCPILVVCYTNHALDQFLEGIHKFLPSGLVRLGGRSNSEVMKEFSLSNLRRSMIRRNLPGYLRAMYAELSQTRELTEKKIQEQAARLEGSLKGVLHEDILKKYIAPHNLIPLESKDYYISGKKSNKIMLEWLGIAVLSQVSTQTVANRGRKKAKEKATVNRFANSKKNTVPSPISEQKRSEEETLSDELGAEEVPLFEEEAEDSLIKVAEEAELLQAERMMDDDDDVQKQIKNALLRVAKAEKEILAFVPDAPEEDEEEDQGEWEISSDMKKKLQKLVKQELQKTDYMDEEAAKQITDLWNLDFQQRWQLYRLWRFKYLTNIRHQILSYENEYQMVVNRLAELRNQEDLTLLKAAHVIGVTTTGAAKYRKVLQDIRAKIVIVEEAAEVLEAHVVTTLSSACEHLILIGDHQQLRPSATVYELARNFNLEISLFERLVRNDIQYVRLDYQHRMRPEIAELLTPHIYDKLENHESVLLYDNIQGVTSNLYFVEHEELEENIEEGRSHQNIHEAAFVKSLCYYFICQGYNPSQITVLTTYTGQLHCLRRIMPRSQFEGVRVCVVDKYQGEENDIIIISLVRSNPQGTVGFLQIPNRVCVALSRARKGLFCIGNMQMLSRVPLWSRIVHTLQNNNRIGKALMLRCQNHPKNVCFASKAEDFKRVPEGGCLERCEYRLDCGHVCTKLCHPYDPMHKKFSCEKPCQKILCQDEHKCPKLCYEPCGSCQVIVTKVIPKCGHTQQVPCSVSPEEFSCQIPCPKVLSCGHKCVRGCGNVCTKKCPEREVVDLKCGHRCKTLCYVKQEAESKGKEMMCYVNCETELECGHICSGTCSKCSEGNPHIPCANQCRHRLLCSHQCSELCSRDCSYCPLHCKNKCPHGACTRMCSEPCVPCMQPCMLGCKHSKCKKLCFEPCDRDPCNEFCKKVLRCSHACIGLCGEVCPTKCRVCNVEEVEEIFFGTEAHPNARFIQLQDCQHIFEVTGFDSWMKAEESDDVIKLKLCPKCSTPVRNSRRYSSIIKQTLADIEKVKRKIADRWASQLSEWLSENSTISCHFPLTSKRLETSLEKEDLCMHEVALIRDKVTNFSKLAEIKSQLKQMSLVSEKSLDSEIKICNMMLERAKNQEDISYPCKRISNLALLAEAYAISQECDVLAACCSDDEFDDRFRLRKKLSLGIQQLQSSTQMSEEETGEFRYFLDRLKRKRFPGFQFPCLNETQHSLLSSGIVKEGQWYKCSNGHICSILECNNGTKEACPECKVIISDV